MTAKEFLKENGFYYENYIYNQNDERYEIAQLLTDYAESLQLLQSCVMHSTDNKKCACCGNEITNKLIKIKHNQLNRYVCSEKCMWDYYK